MKLVIVNGSPRGRKSNSDKILEWLWAEIKHVQGVAYEKLYAVKLNEYAEHIESLKSADYIVIIFPLYTDSMPGITKHYFEYMENNKSNLKGKPVLFIIHSGFPEALHSRAVKRYTEYFSTLIGMKHMGSIIMGNSESLAAAPESFFRRKIIAFNAIGKAIIDGREFEEVHIKEIQKPEKLSGLAMFIMKHLKVSDFYWNNELKKNNAYKKRFERPYV